MHFLLPILAVGESPATERHQINQSIGCGWMCHYALIEPEFAGAFAVSWHQSINQSLYQLITLLINHPLNQSINQSINQSVSQSDNSQRRLHQKLLWLVCSGVTQWCHVYAQLQLSSGGRLDYQWGSLNVEEHNLNSLSVSLFSCLSDIHHITQLLIKFSKEVNQTKMLK